VTNRWMLRPLAAGVLAAAGLLVASPALAHEHRAVGPYSFVVGWRNEPSYSDSLNAVQIFVKDGAGNPVPGVCDALQVIVSSGAQKTKPLAMKPVFNSPTECNTALLPTRPGTYTFRFQGKIGDTAVDEAFTSSSKTFNDVEDSSAIQFPAQDPTRGQLAQRVVRLDRRDQAQLDAVARHADADRRLGIAGVATAAFAVLALLVVVAVEAVRRRKAAPR
jgi:hypothetical protein